MRVRFAIRDLLWFTALIAIGLGWWLEHRRAAEYQRKAEFVVGRLMGVQKSHQVEMWYGYYEMERREKWVPLFPNTAAFMIAKLIGV